MLSKPFEVLGRSFHCSAALNAKFDDNGLPVMEKWTKKNKTVHSPDKPVSSYCIEFKVNQIRKDRLVEITYETLIYVCSRLHLTYTTLGLR